MSMSGRREDLYPSRQAPKPQMLPRRDPVVHDEWSPDAPLSREQTASYERDGFLVLENVFDAGEIEILQREAARMRAAPEELDDETTITEPGSGAVRSVFKLHRQSAIFARLAADARLANVAQLLLADDVYLHQSRLNYKPGFRGKEFYWHSDFETWHVEDGMPRMRALSMSVLLNDNTPANGPTMFMKGSHKLYATCVGETPEDHYRQSLKKQEYGVPDEESLTALASGGVAMPTGPAGTVVIFDCNTMHGSNSNIAPAPRSNAFFVFNAVSNKLEAPFGATAPRPEFIAAREHTETIRPVRGRLLKHAA
jgi:ectoine hydroxylase